MSDKTHSLHRWRAVLCVFLVGLCGFALLHGAAHHGHDEGRVCPICLFGAVFAVLFVAARPIFAASRTTFSLPTARPTTASRWFAPPRRGPPAFH